MILRTFLPSLALAVSASTLTAADVYVAPSGNDAASGSMSAPFKTIQKGVGSVGAGGHVWIRGGTYREEITVGSSGTAAAPLVISAYGSEKPVIKGSREVTGWVQHSGSIYKKTGWTVESQQVFVNGASLAQCGIPAMYGNGTSVDGTKYFTSTIGSGIASLAPGRFWYDRAGKVLYVWLADSGNPANSVMEASTQRRIMELISSSYVQVKGLAFRHCNASAFAIQGGGIEMGNHTRLENCDIQWCDFAGVAMGYQKSGDEIIGCTVSNCGDSGINGSSSSQFTISGCTIAYNNYRNFNFMWHAGGVKLATDAYGTLDHNNVHDNKGNGIWFDYVDSGAASVVNGNTVTGNAGDAGIMIEASKSVTVKNNVLVGNGRRGLYVAASDNVVVAHNTFSANSGVATVCVAGMPRAGKTLTNISVFDNVISGNTASSDIMIVKENGGDIKGLTCDYNCVWRPSGSIAMWSGLDGRGGWAGTTYTSMTAWRAATAFSDHCKQSDPKFVSGGYELQGSSPAINGGKLLSAVTVDIQGVPRTTGGAPDMGAYEFGGTPTPSPAPVPAPTPTPSVGVLSVQVNFQPAASAAVAGYIVDSGATFASRNGHSYGWSAPCDSRERNKLSDQLRDTQVLMQGPQNPNGTWEMAVANGTYRVHAVCGDPAFFDGYNKLDIEGVRAIDAYATSAAPFHEGTVTVTVKDGRLTVGSASGAYNNKICCLEIQQQ